MTLSQAATITLISLTALSAAAYFGRRSVTDSQPTPWQIALAVRFAWLMALHGIFCVAGRAA